MDTEIYVRRLKKSWQYDFKLPDKKRERKGKFRTKAAAFEAGLQRMKVLQNNTEKITLKEAYETYVRVSQLKDRTRDTYSHHWGVIEPLIGHMYISEITTTVLDEFKVQLPSRLGPRTMNHHLTLVRAVLRFMWKRQKLALLPYIPMMKVPVKEQPWYTTVERDRLLTEMHLKYPQWYLFFYITCRLGLRRAEVYAIARRQVKDIPPRLVVDQQVQRGTKTREACLITRKNNETYTLELPEDVMAAIKWHISQGYAGSEFLFSKDGTFPKYIDSYMRPLITVQRKLGLQELGHHAIGRHSVASQAATRGESIKAIQAQLGHRSESSTHKYAHLGSGAQLKVVESLTPDSPPHSATS